ncbi:hypothetical protein AB0I81_60005 [Nonomuraea sp. NPDC050404]
MTDTSTQWDRQEESEYQPLQTDALPATAHLQARKTRLATGWGMR